MHIHWSEDADKVLIFNTVFLFDPYLTRGDTITLPSMFWGVIIFVDFLQTQCKIYIYNLVSPLPF